MTRPQHLDLSSKLTHLAFHPRSLPTEKPQTSHVTPARDQTGHGEQLPCSRRTRVRLRQPSPPRWRAEGAPPAPPLCVHRRGVVPPPLPGARRDSLADPRIRDRESVRAVRCAFLLARAELGVIVYRLVLV